MWKKIITPYYAIRGPGSVVDWLRAVRSGDRIPVAARFSAPVQTGPRAHAASCTAGTGYFPGVKSGLGVTLSPHPLLVPWSRKCKAIPLIPLWAVRPVQSLSACTRVQFTFSITQYTCCSRHAEDDDTPSQEVRTLPALPLSAISSCFLDTHRIILEFTFTN